MTASFKPVPNLDQLVAKMIENNVQSVVLATEAEAKRLAPGTKTWRTKNDVHVRRTHRAMNGKSIPFNLLFEVQAYQWDVDHPGAMPVERNHGGGHQFRDAPIAPGAINYMTGPRDSRGGGYVQNVSCRCELIVDGNGIAKFVGSKRARAEGTKVSGMVFAEGEGVIPAEYGDVYPGGRVGEGSMFMHRTVTNMGNRA